MIFSFLRSSSSHQRWDEAAAEGGQQLPVEGAEAGHAAQLQLPAAREEALPLGGRQQLPGTLFSVAVVRFEGRILHRIWKETKSQVKQSNQLFLTLPPFPVRYPADVHCRLSITATRNAKPNARFRFS